MPNTLGRPERLDRGAEGVTRDDRSDSRRFLAVLLSAVITLGFSLLVLIGSIPLTNGFWSAMGHPAAFDWALWMFQSAVMLVALVGFGCVLHALIRTLASPLEVLIGVCVANLGVGVFEVLRYTSYRQATLGDVAMVLPWLLFAPAGAALRWRRGPTAAAQQAHQPGSRKVD